MPRQIIVFLCLAVGMLGGAAAARAATGPDLFHVRVPLADRTAAGRGAAFQDAMKIVLVRVTGRRAAATDPSFAPLIAVAARYVQEYRSAAEGQLWIGFDGAAIERWLAQNGQPVWGRARPSTFVWLLVQGGPHAGTIVTGTDNSELKAAIDAQAEQRGIALIWPSAAELQSYRLDYSSARIASADSLAAIARRLGAAGVLIGRALNGTATAGVSWNLLFQHQVNAAVGTVEGVDIAADTYASLFAATGGVLPVDIDVDGIRGVEDYARVQGYLESLSLVAQVAVLGLTGDSVEFRLSSRGGAAPLERTLALNGPLEPGAAGADGNPRFHLRP